MAFHFKDGHQAVSNVHDAGILPRPHDNLRALGRKALQEHPRALVRTMFAPHHGEQPQLCKVRRSSKDRDDLAVLLLAQAVARDNFGGNRRLCHCD